jgi:hypothetical protein
MRLVSIGEDFLEFSITSCKMKGEARMAKLRANHFNEALLLIAVCAVSATLGFVLRPNKIAIVKANSSASSRQSDEKLIQRYDHGNEPVEFDNFRINKVKIVPGQKFSATSLIESNGGRFEDWLDNLEFTLKNVSDKEITFIRLELQFPDTDITGARMVYSKLGIGKYAYASVDELKNSKPLALKPGDAIIFRLSADDLQKIKDFLGLNNIQLANINNVALRLVYVIFDDGIKWELRNYYRPKPNTPGDYERIDPKIQ